MLQGDLPLGEVKGLDFVPDYSKLGLSKEEWDSLSKPNPNSVLEFKVCLKPPTSSLSPRAPWLLVKANPHFKSIAPSPTQPPMEYEKYMPDWDVLTC